MDSRKNWVIELSSNSGILNPTQVGGKAENLSKLVNLGFKVPHGFCITASAYQYFIDKNNLNQLIEYETQRKPLDTMRWEELWDAALRIRSAFLKSEIPHELLDEISKIFQKYPKNTKFAVRSSAVGEDSENLSYAGIHESVLNVLGEDALQDAIKCVWASLWSDRALLYLKELKLNTQNSSMPVVVQKMEYESISGVSFGQSPLESQKTCAMIEAVKGSCQDLVDGNISPDRWLVERETGRVVSWTQGMDEELGRSVGEPLLSEFEIKQVFESIKKVEHSLNFIPDIEWTGQEARYTLLQARPITTIEKPENDVREWYKSLKLKYQDLNTLHDKVVFELIPELKKLGDSFAQQSLEHFDNQSLAECIKERYQATIYWKKVYFEEFIPFAHGVRFLAVYYNDAVKPNDPYEFVALLQGQDMLATKRNKALNAFASELRENPKLYSDYLGLVQKINENPDFASLPQSDALVQFTDKIKKFVENSMDFVFEGVRLTEHAGFIYQQIAMLAETENKKETVKSDPKYFKDKLLKAIPNEQHQEALHIIKLGQISWKLRDDDNLLLSRVESQFLKALKLGLQKLNVAEDIIIDSETAEQITEDIIQSLISGKTYSAKTITHSEIAPQKNVLEHQSRQLVGQPASRGLAAGNACVLLNPSDLGKFRQGDIIVCKAIQPMMTHLIPLAKGIVEQRGGMLIHGAIIARELNIPCVNGVNFATQKIQNGDWLTVDGDLGIVSVGAPDFSLEE